MTYEPKYLGKKGIEYQGLDPIPVDNPAESVTMTSDEVTAICPLTGQPDLYQVTVTYSPQKFLCESKSLKLFFFSLRNKGVFAEQLAVDIAEEFTKYIKPYGVRVSVEQKARGGISITASAQRPVAKTLGEVLRSAITGQPNGGEPELPEGEDVVTQVVSGKTLQRELSTHPAGPFDSEKNYIIRSSPTKGVEVLGIWEDKD